MSERRATPKQCRIRRYLVRVSKKIKHLRTCTEFHKTVEKSSNTRFYFIRPRDQNKNITKIKAKDIKDQTTTSMDHKLL